MGRCQETAGFLISAACSNPAEKKCQQCGKAICDRHARKSLESSNHVCIGCFRNSSSSYGQSNDDPYLYSGTQHRDYYTYALPGAALGVGATVAAADWASGRSAFQDQPDTDWTEESWEDDFDGS